MIESKCVKAVLMRLRSHTRKRCSVKIKLATRVHVYYTKIPMCELTRHSRRKPRSGAHWRRGTDVTSLFVESLRHAPAPSQPRQEEHVTRGLSPAVGTSKDRDCPGSKHTIKKNLTTSLASWPVPVVPAFGRPR